ncbi:MAG: hypothetical protein WA821_08525 [Anaerolineales bacterium]
MSTNGSDAATFLFLFVCAGFQIILYLLFAILVSRQSDMVVSRRWKASILMGIIQCVTIVVGFGLLSLFVTAKDVAFSFDMNMIARLSTAIPSVFALSTMIICLAMPFVFLATFGSYIRFIQTCDFMLDKYWKLPQQSLTSKANLKIDSDTYFQRSIK